MKTSPLPSHFPNCRAVNPMGEGGPQGRVRVRTDGLKRALGILCLTRFHTGDVLAQECRVATQPRYLLYYLTHRDRVDACLKEQKRTADKIRQELHNRQSDFLADLRRRSPIQRQSHSQ